MPNHITNRLQVIGDEKYVQKLFAAIKGEKTEDGKEIKIDFNKIIPMPETLNIESGSTGESAHALLFGSKRRFYQSTEELQKWLTSLDYEERKKAVLMGLQYQENIEKYGVATWYDWAIKHWGTKWNAYGQDDERDTEDTIHFQTAWSAPIYLMQRLSGLFPKVELVLTYADEDTGSNTGIIHFENGEVTDCFQPDSQSKEGYELAFELNPGNEEYYKFNKVTGTYEYNEDEE